MNRKLVEYIADYILKTIESRSKKNRLLFLGPTTQIMKDVFEFLRDNHVLDQFSTPVYLVGQNSKIVNFNSTERYQCIDFESLMNVRNNPSTVEFFALISPENQNINTSLTSAVKSIGMDIENGNVDVLFENWWEDSFIQKLVSYALNDIFHFAEHDYTEAVRLLKVVGQSIEDSISNSTERHKQFWNLIIRLFYPYSNTENLPNFSSFLYACGVPNVEQSSNFNSQYVVKMMNSIGDTFSLGISKGEDKLVELIGENSELAYLDSYIALFKDHLLRQNPTLVQLKDSMLYLYSPHQPDNCINVPEWWLKLTLEKWQDIFSEIGSVDDKGSLVLSCGNDLLLSKTGYKKSICIVENEITISITREIVDNTELCSESVTVKGLDKKFDSEYSFNENQQVINLPCFYPEEGKERKTPYSISAVADGFKKGGLKVISLKNWKPAAVFVIPSLNKFVSPKTISSSTKNKWYAEIELETSGETQCYVFLRPNIKYTGLKLKDNTSSTSTSFSNEKYKKIEENIFLFDLDISQGIDYEFSFKDEKGNEITHSLYFDIKNEDVHGCDSIFDLLIRKNNKLSTNKKNIDLQLHFLSNTTFANLEREILNWSKKEDIDSQALSCYPIVMADDNQDVMSFELKENEKKPNNFAKLSFNADPRPALLAMNIPEGFLKARRELFEFLLSDEDCQNLEEINLAVLNREEKESKSLRDLIESYIREYLEWLQYDKNAVLCDTIYLHRTINHNLEETPYAIVITPLHPLKMAWHYLAQIKLNDALEANMPCPAGCILSPNKTPSVLHLPLYLGGDSSSTANFIAIETNSNYWSVLWNIDELKRISEILETSPLNKDSGLSTASFNGSFSEVQVKKSLDDICELLIAKPNLSIAITGEEGVSLSTNRGLQSWILDNVSSENSDENTSVRKKNFFFYDFRNEDAVIDDTVISSFSEATSQKVLWYKMKNSLEKRTNVDLGIISQLSFQSYHLKEKDEKYQQSSPMSKDGMQFYTIRSPFLDGAFTDSLSDKKITESEDLIEDYFTSSIELFERIGVVDSNNIGLQFVPDRQKIINLFDKQHAKYVVISSSTFDPSSFSNNAIEGALLWDYDLPNYSLRAGDSSGYYLLTSITKGAQVSLKNSICNLLLTKNNRDRFTDIASSLDFCSNTLLEISKRGIPKIRSLSGFDTTARGDLGVFIATRLLQDKFRPNENYSSLLDISEKDPNNTKNCFVNMVIPVDPFQHYIDDLCISLGCNKIRPDLLVASIYVDDYENTMNIASIKLTPIEVKFRKNDLQDIEEKHAFDQAKSFSILIKAILDAADKTNENRKLSLWKLTYQNFLTNMLSYGFRLYGNLKKDRNNLIDEWQKIEYKTACFILDNKNNVDIDPEGRVIEIYDCIDNLFQFNENRLVLTRESAADIVIGKPDDIYFNMKKRLGDWRIKPVIDPKEDVNSSKNDDHSNVIDGKPTIGDITPITSIDNHISDEILLSSKNHVETDPPCTINKDFSLNGVSLELGTDCDSFEKQNVSLNISNTAVNQLNMGIVGDLGTGKTQLVKSIIYQLCHCSSSNRGIQPNILVLDYKKDFSNESSAEFLKAVNATVLRPHEKPLPLNIFDISDDVDLNNQSGVQQRINRMSMNLNEILSKVNQGIGTVQKLNLKTAISNAYKNSSDGIPTIYDVYEEYKGIVSKPDSPQYVLDSITSLFIFEQDKSKIVKFKDLFKGVVILDLSELKTYIKNTLIAIMLEFFYRYMIKLPKMKYIGKKPKETRAIQSYLVVDEAVNLMRYRFDTLYTVLTQDREFGTGVILASQYLSQFKHPGVDYKESLLTWFIHKNRDIQEKDLNKVGIIKDAEKISQRLNNLEELTCYYKSNNENAYHIRDNAFFKILEQIKNQNHS